MTNGLEDWTTEKHNGRNVLFYKGKNYIPRNMELRQDIVKMFHNHKMAGHPGELETYNSVRQHYWWPGLRTFIKNYIKGCGICQQFKIDRNPSKPAFLPTEGAKSTRPFAKFSMDLITDLPLAEGHNSILVVVDQGLTKGVILIPCSKTITLEETAKLLLENLYRQDYFRQRISIRFKSFCWTPETTRNQICTVDSLSSTDGQNNRTKKPGNWSSCQYIALLIQKNGQQLYTPLNSHITIDKMQTDWKTLSNLCLENSR